LKQVTYYHDRIDNKEDTNATVKEAKSFIRRITKEKEERDRQKQLKE